MTTNEAESLKSEMIELREKAYNTLKKYPNKDYSTKAFKCCKWAEDLLEKSNSIEGSIYFYLNPKKWDDWKNDNNTLRWLKDNKAFIPA